MMKLLRAEMRRHFVCRLFFVFACLSLGVGVWLGIRLYREPFFGTVHLWLIFLQWMLISLFVALTIGKEYSHGGFRRKCVTGHTKSAVFLSELLVSLLSATALFLICGGAVAAINARLIPNFGIKLLLLFLIVVWLENVVIVCTVYVLSALIPQPTASAALSILLVFGMLLWADTVGVRLEQEEYTETIRYDYATGTVEKIPEKNPSYVGSPWRNILEPINTCLPVTQISFCEIALRSYFYSEEAIEKAWEGLGSRPTQQFNPITAEELQAIRGFPFYSLGWIASVIPIGFLLFRKKELK